MHENDLFRSVPGVLSAMLSSQERKPDSTPSSAANMQLKSKLSKMSSAIPKFIFW